MRESGEHGVTELPNRKKSDGQESIKQGAAFRRSRYDVKRIRGPYSRDPQALGEKSGNALTASGDFDEAV